MKKILTVSLVAMMAVSAARADIASKAYVDVNENGNYVLTTNTAGQNIKLLDSKLGALPEGKTAAQAISDAITSATYNDTALVNRVTTAEADIDALESGKQDIQIGTTSDAGKAVVVASDGKIGMSDNALGSAAYTASTAYATAQQGTTADNTAAAVNNATTGLAATKAIADEAKATADAALPAPVPACSDATNKCVLVSDGTNLAWEVVAR